MLMLLVGVDAETFFISLLEKRKLNCFASFPLASCASDVLQEVNRNLEDAICVVRNIMKDAKVLPGAGATEMAVAAFLRKKANTVQGQMAFPYKAVAKALEVPFTANCFFLKFVEKLQAGAICVSI